MTDLRNARIDLSVVVPVFNEEDNLAPLYERAARKAELQPGDVLPEDLLFQRGDGSHHRAKAHGA